MDISIIIVNYNTKALLKQCLQSVFEKTQNISFEIIVVDNVSLDGSQEMLKTEYPGVILIESSQNIGFGKANNLGAKSAKGKYLFLLNPDTILINNAVKTLFDFIEKNQNCGICGGNLFDENLQPMLSYSDMCGIGTELKMLFRTPKQEFNNSGNAKQVGYITGADLMIRSDLFCSLKGFDADFFMYYEDPELTFRVKKTGYSVYNVPQAQIIHLEGKSSNTEQKIKFSLNSRRIYYLKMYCCLYRRIADFIFFLTIISRLLAFTILRNKEKLEYWKYTYRYFKF